MRAEYKIILEAQFYEAQLQPYTHASLETHLIFYISGVEILRNPLSNNI